MMVGRNGSDAVPVDRRTFAHADGAACSFDHSGHWSDYRSGNRQARRRTSKIIANPIYELPPAHVAGVGGVESLAGRVRTCRGAPHRVCKIVDITGRHDRSPAIDESKLAGFKRRRQLCERRLVIRSIYCARANGRHFNAAIIVFQGAAFAFGLGRNVAVVRTRRRRLVLADINAPRETVNADGTQMDDPAHARLAGRLNNVDNAEDITVPKSLPWSPIGYVARSVINNLRVRNAWRETCAVGYVAFDNTKAFDPVQKTAIARGSNKTGDLIAPGEKAMA